MDKRVFQTMLVCMVVAYLWYFWMLQKYKKSPEPNTPPPAEATLKALPAPDLHARPSTASDMPRTVEQHFDERQAAVETANVSYVFTNRGAAIKSATLKEHKASVDGNENLRLLDEFVPGRLSCALVLLDAESKQVVEQLDQLNFEQVTVGESFDFTAGGALEYKAVTPTATIIKRYEFNADDNSVTLSLQFSKNGAAKPFVYRLYPAQGIEDSEQDPHNLMAMTVNVHNETNHYRTNELVQYSKNGKRDHAINIAQPLWNGMLTRYFSAAALAHEGTTVARCGIELLTPLESPTPQASPFMESAPVDLSQQNSAAQTFTYYVGPRKYAPKTFYKIMEFRLWFINLNAISVPLMLILVAFHSVVFNYGIAVILLTILVRLLIFPLSRRQFYSMKAMVAVAPRMQAIQNKYKDNMRKRNEEMMKLYRTYSINPLGGCLPMLLQFPVFVGLYQALSNSIELRHASFLWARDLSRPDTVGHLPFSIPWIGDGINPLPLLFIIAMIAQMRMTPTPTTTPEQEMQRKIMMFLVPLLMLFMFYRIVPSGLVLYFFASALVSVLEQWYLRHGYAHSAQAKRFATLQEAEAK